eukprot:GDKK01015684.1.p1 GENE.GDKK01015684.1~~GDKK01015684.1.p1  ORF type:complete len:537 (-),score=110.84 GDKK01015684.1:148-1725(-)
MKDSLSVDPSVIDGINFYPYGTVITASCKSMTTMDPPGGTTRLQCSNGVFTDLDFSCYPDCVKLPLSLANNDERITRGKRPNAYFLYNADTEFPYDNFQSLVSSHPDVLRHSGEFQMGCAAASDPSRPYRVRDGKGSQFFMLTYARRFVGDSTNFFTTGGLIKQRWKISSARNKMWQLLNAVTAVPEYAYLTPFAKAAVDSFGKNQMDATITIPPHIKKLLVDMIIRPGVEGLSGVWQTSAITQLRYEMLQRFGGLDLPLDRARPELVKFTHTSFVYQYYGFFCRECGLSGKTLVRHAKMGGVVAGPFKRVRCMYGAWTDTAFTCDTFRDFTERDIRSTKCVICSQSWRLGHASARGVEADSLVGQQLVPRWLMQGYHLWAPYVVRMYDRCSLLMDVFPTSHSTAIVSTIGQWFLLPSSQVGEKFLSSSSWMETLFGSLVLVAILPLSLVASLVASLQSTSISSASSDLLPIPTLSLETGDSDANWALMQDSAVGLTIIFTHFVFMVLICAVIRGAVRRTVQKLF